MAQRVKLNIHEYSTISVYKSNLAPGIKIDFNQVTVKSRRISPNKLYFRIFDGVRPSVRLSVNNRIQMNPKRSL